ncbi:hypothetical protein BsWGS_07587 [Bradybaena similaris]
MKPNNPLNSGSLSVPMLHRELAGSSEAHDVGRSPVSQGMKEQHTPLVISHDYHDRSNIESKFAVQKERQKQTDIQYPNGFTLCHQYRCVLAAATTVATMPSCQSSGVRSSKPHQGWNVKKQAVLPVPPCQNRNQKVFRPVKAAGKIPDTSPIKSRSCVYICC